ncbi:MAG: DUF308 domain-containing protein [Corallococcus sp.]|nr:DUF308 domain-containing protein [Corallococcus sp.]
MNTLLKKAKKTSIIASVLYIVLGIFLIVSPQTTLSLVCKLFGALLIVGGFISVIDYFLYGYEPFGLMGGALNITLGIIICSSSAKVAQSAFFPVLCGIVFLIHAVTEIQNSVDYRKARVKCWWINLIFAALLMIAGIMLVINPFDNAAYLYLFFGISLLVDGICSLATTLFISSRAKRVKKNIKQIFAPVDYEIKDADEEDKNNLQ